MFVVIALMSLATSAGAQDSSILPGQAEALRLLWLDRGQALHTLDDYLVLHWGYGMRRISQKNTAEAIRVLQADTVVDLPASSGKSEPASARSLSPAVSSVAPVLSPAALPEPIIAGMLEPGMSKVFHLVDGNIIQGTIICIDSNVCHIETTDGVLRVSQRDILEETAEVTKRDGSRYVGPVLKESLESLTLRSRYGDALIEKKDVQDMNRYHGGKLVPWAEEKKKFYRGDVLLTDIFFDPTAFPLDPNTLYISALSLGYGFTNSFMVRTSFGNNFTGDLNLQPLFQFYSRRTATSKVALAVGVDMFSHHDMTSVIAKYARYVARVSDGKSLDDLASNSVLRVPVSSVIDPSYRSTFYAEMYFVYSHLWTLETGRGEMGYHLGFRTNTLPFIRNSILAPSYRWSDEKIGKVPFRLWAAFEYDLTKNLKLAANVWADNGYRFRTLNQVFNDYMRDDTPLILDGTEGEYRTVDFDFGLLYAVNSSLRLGIHFKDPYLELFWRILEF